MRIPEILLYALLGWSALGGLGITLSWLRRERPQALRHLGWLAAVWVLYLGVLVSVSLLTPLRRVAPGQDRCFGSLCFAVTGVQWLTPYRGRDAEPDDSRLLRVSVRISNHDSGAAQRNLHMQAYLLDSHGNHWEQVPGLSGNALTTPVAAQRSVLSQPVFKVPGGVNLVGLVLTQGDWQLTRLVISDPDSLLHRPAVVPLPPPPATTALVPRTAGRAASHPPGS